MLNPKRIQKLNRTVRSNGVLISQLVKLRQRLKRQGGSEQQIEMLTFRIAQLRHTQQDLMAARMGIQT